MEGIDHLPIELLLRIFKLSLRIASLKEDRARFMLVCRLWRDIMVRSSYLWTEISSGDHQGYIQRSIEMSGESPLDLYHDADSDRRLSFNSRQLLSFLSWLLPHASRWRTISIAQDDFISSKAGVYRHMFNLLQTTQMPQLETFRLFDDPSQRQLPQINQSLLSLYQLPGTAAFPKLSALEIDGVPCKVSTPGLWLRNAASLNLVDVAEVPGEQLFEVLRHSPSLERLELGRSPKSYDPDLPVAPFHLPHLQVLHLVHMPPPISNFLLSRIYAVNCSDLLVYTSLPDGCDDVVANCLFASNTTHFIPILQGLWTNCTYKDITITRLAANSTFMFDLRCHNEHWSLSNTCGAFQLKLELTTIRQAMETFRWLANCISRDEPKPCIRLRLDGLMDMPLLDLFDSYGIITHFDVRRGQLNATKALLSHLRKPTQTGWPLPDMQTLVLDAWDDHDASRNEDAIVEMVQTRYGQAGAIHGWTAEKENSNMKPPQLLSGLHLNDIGWPLNEDESDDYPSKWMKEEVLKILPNANIHQDACVEVYW